MNSVVQVCPDWCLSSLRAWKFYQFDISACVFTPFLIRFLYILKIKYQLSLGYQLCPRLFFFFFFMLTCEVSSARVCVCGSSRSGHMTQACLWEFSLGRWWQKQHCTLALEPGMRHMSTQWLHPHHAVRGCNMRKCTHTRTHTLHLKLQHSHWKNTFLPANSFIDHEICIMCTVINMDWHYNSTLKVLLFFKGHIHIYIIWWLIRLLGLDWGGKKGIYSLTHPNSML